MRTVAVLALLAACGGGESTPSEDTETPPVGGAEVDVADAPGLTLEEVGKEVEAALDRDTKPCDDFYQFACGGWLASMELPADKTRYTRSFTSIYDTNEALLKEILQEAAKNPGEDPGMQKVGAVYGSCMDEAAVDAAGIAPLKPMLDEIEAAGDLGAVSKLWGKYGMYNVGAPIGVSVFADFKDPDLNILHMGQSGLGLPDRDYYLDLDDKGTALLADYQKHVARMLVLAGAEQAAADADAKAIVAFETQLAGTHLPRHELRDPEANYHRLEREGTRDLLKNIDIDAMFEGMGYPDIQAINVERPEVFEATDALIGKTDLAVIKAYLRWHTIDAMSTSLTTEMANANFEFFGKRLRDQKEIRPRWKRCVSRTQGHLGDVLSKLYVERRFAGDSKAKAEEMITDIQGAFEEGLPELAWMDEKTQQRAKDKVATLQNKIGYPKKWRDFSQLEVSEDDLFANNLAITENTSRFWLDKVGKPVDKDEWFMSASDVNAYYNPLNNEMAFPAGILQPPFFSKDFPTAMNYGAIGMVMGHELTHGFDDSGRKFAPDGKMVEWWEPTASEKFEEVAACVEKQYSGFEVLPGLNLNGKLTLGENIADLGGIKESHRAYMNWAKRTGTKEELAGFTGEQLLFVAFAQGWCTEMTEELLKERVATDTHSDAKSRVNGPLMNLPAFGEAFECEVGSAMRPKEEDICAVW